MLLNAYINLSVFYLYISCPVVLSDATSTDVSTTCENPPGQAPLLADCQAVMSRIPNDNDKVKIPRQGDDDFGVWSSGKRVVTFFIISANTNIRAGSD